MEQINRRSFIKGAAATAAGIAGAGILQPTTYAHASETTAVTFADTISWNVEYDVIVAGCGAAGSSAAIYAADNGARVLLVDSAPDGEAGGNSRLCAQMACTADDADSAYQYYKDGLFWHFNVDEALLHTYTEGEAQIPELFNYLGVESDVMWQIASGTDTSYITPEYPEYSSIGGDTIAMTFAHQGMFDSALFKIIHQNIVDRVASIDVWYDSPLVHLVQDPETKTIVGAQIERLDETLNARALSGVVLACGGFENNPQMIQTFLGCAKLAPYGSLYNKGDGVRIALEVGADLKNMSAYESLGILSGNTWTVEEGHRARFEYATNDKGVYKPLSLDSGLYGTGSVILVGDDGDRFIDEYSHTRHGHVYSSGVWRMPIANWAPHLIFDQAKFDELDAAGYLNDDRKAKLASAATPEDLAAQIGVDADILARAISDFNMFAEQGRDYKMNRAAESMRAFSGDVYYAAEFTPTILNTQGGPVRNSNAEVLDTEGNPIPHLYSAGELGGITSFQYNSGGNIAECLIFGKIAGINAAAAKDELQAATIPTAVEDDIKYQQGESVDEPAAAYEVDLADGEYLGTSTLGMGGAMYVKVAYDGSKITAVDILQETETPEYGGAIIDQLAQNIVDAGSTDVDTVAGATLTSVALIAAVEDAISQA